MLLLHLCDRCHMSFMSKYMISFCSGSHKTLGLLPSSSSSGLVDHLLQTKIPSQSCCFPEQTPPSISWRKKYIFFFQDVEIPFSSFTKLFAIYSWTIQIIFFFNRFFFLQFLGQITNIIINVIIYSQQWEYKLLSGQELIPETLLGIYMFNHYSLFFIHLQIKYINLYQFTALSILMDSYICNKHPCGCKLNVF